MEVSKEKQLYRLVVSRNELKLLERCLREAIKIGEAEFESRVGESTARARQFLKYIEDVKTGSAYEG
jgi:hypothetical protein